ncbi:efflux RND transporter periplasmic adaptor subunit [Candidatus Magnetaquicoccus inordinatus]|uniref:efflux RND transporter periplasmic adaptor subunit n=1 Tax=Candidatus Magnetaquicoccus inordinatus TaxID=2496818 RepID=UPI00187D359B|nr:efflux RND transporter periplasmic adaptor subunit [Candidatus Magnetaquicoccus inordinatus]
MWSRKKPTKAIAKSRKAIDKPKLLWLLLGALVLCPGSPLTAAEERSRAQHPALASSATAETTASWRVELYAKRRTQLSSEMAARITRLSVREGGRFAKGELLVAFDCALEQAQLQRARALLEVAEAKAQVNDRLSRLQATSKLEEKVAQAEVAQARAEVAIIQVKIDHCQIHAPYAGRVINVSAQEHQFVKAGDPLLEILDEQNLELLFLLPSRQLPQFSLGEPIEITIDETQRSYPAKISAFGAMIDSVSQSIKLFATIDGQFNELLPGMSGYARLPGREGSGNPRHLP